MFPTLPMMTALDFNPQLNPLSDHIRQINHNQHQNVWKDRIVSVLPLAFSAVVFGALWVAGVSTFGAAAALATFAGAYIVIKLMARKIQLTPPKSLLSPPSPLNMADATVPAPKKSVPNDRQQTHHRIYARKGAAEIQSQKLADAEQQRAVAVQLNKTLQEQNAALQETCQQTTAQLHQSHDRHQTEIHDKDQEIAGLQQQSMQLKEQLTETRDQFSKCAEDSEVLRKRSESAESAVKKLRQELEQSIQTIDDYNARITRSALHLENLLARDQQSQQAIQQLTAGNSEAQRELRKYRQNLNIVMEQLEKAQDLQTHLERQLEQQEATIRQNTQSEQALSLSLKQVKEAQKMSEQQFLRDKHNYQNELQGKNVSIQGYKQQLMALQTQLQRQMAKENARTRELSLLQSDLSAKAFEIQQLQKQHNDLKNGFEHQQSQYRKQLITRQLKEKEAAVAKMAGDQKTQVEKHQQAIRTLEDKHQTTEASLNEQLSTVRKAHEESSTELSEAQQMNQTLLAKTSLLEIKLREAESEKETSRSALQLRNEQFQQSLLVNETTSQALQEALGETSTAPTKCQKQCKLEEQRVQALQKELTQIQATLSTLQESVRQAKEENHTLRSSVKSMETAVTEVNIEKNNALKALNAQYTEEIAGLKHELNERRQSHLTLPKEHAQHLLDEENTTRTRQTELKTIPDLKQRSGVFKEKHQTLRRLHNLKRLHNLTRRHIELKLKYRQLSQIIDGLAQNLRDETAKIVETFKERQPELPSLSTYLQLDKLRKIEPIIAETKSPASPQEPKPESTSVAASPVKRAPDAHWLPPECLKRSQSTSALDLFYQRPEFEQSLIRYDIKQQLPTKTASAPYRAPHWLSDGQLKHSQSTTALDAFNVQSDTLQ